MVIAVPQVFAQEANSTEPAGAVVERCMLAQNYIKNIQKPRDLKARVDRLQAYRYIYQRIDIFTRRLEKNNQPEASNLRATLNDFNKIIDSFKNDYESYDYAREQLTEIKNCRNNFAAFETALANARVKRSAVNEDITAIDTLLNPKLSSQMEILYQKLLLVKKNEGANG